MTPKLVEVARYVRSQPGRSAGSPVAFTPDLWRVERRGWKGFWNGAARRSPAGSI